MSGFDNDVVYAKNADFTQVDNQSVSENNGLITNGQLWIGTTSVNAGGTHVNVGALTSPDSSLSIGFSSPNITLQAGTAMGTLKTLTPTEDFDGTAATPISGTSGNINAFGVNPSFATVTETLNSTGAATGNLQIENRAWLSGLVVDSSTTPGTRGTFSTIASALTAAVSGQTIFIRTGTYTENLTLKAGVNLTAFGSDSSINGTGKVIISGNATLSTAGSVTISGIQLQTNSAALLTVSGSAASIVNLENCYLNCTNATGISFTTANTAAAINCFRCQGNLGTTGIALYSQSSTGTMMFEYCYFYNTGVSVTASTNSAGFIFFNYSTGPYAFSTSSTGSFQATQSILNIGALSNTTAVTTAGTSSTNGLTSSTVSTGSASAVSIGSGTTMQICLTMIESSNTNAITGAGTVVYSSISFQSTSSLINTTTQTRRNFSTGGISFDGGVNTLSNYTVGTFTPTMVGGSTAGTTTYTTQQGYYTRIGGLVQLQIIVSGSAATGTGVATFGGFPFTIKNQTNGNPVGTILSNVAASWTFPVGTTFLSFFGNINAITGLAYGSGSAVAGNFLSIANAAFSFQISLMHQV